MSRVQRFGDARDLCFSCMRPVERCGDGKTICTYTEATSHDKNSRTITNPIITHEGVSSWRLGEINGVVV